MVIKLLNYYLGGGAKQKSSTEMLDFFMQYTFILSALYVLTAFSSKSQDVKIFTKKRLYQVAV